MGRSDRWVQAIRVAATFVAMGGGLVVSGVARADDCQGDVSRLSAKRQSFIDQLNHQAKGPKGQLDAETSCPKLRGLAGAERDLLGYLTKNKDWCQVPDEAITNITASMTKSTAIATQACNVAAQMRKAQQQAANGGGATGAPIQKLPAGPL
jgi:hypothetical protein